MLVVAKALYFNAFEDKARITYIGRGALLGSFNAQRIFLNPHGHDHVRVGDPVFRFGLENTGTLGTIDFEPHSICFCGSQTFKDKAVVEANFAVVALDLRAYGFACSSDILSGRRHLRRLRRIVDVEFDGHGLVAKKRGPVYCINEWTGLQHHTSFARRGN